MSTKLAREELNVSMLGAPELVDLAEREATFACAERGMLTSSIMDGAKKEAEAGREEWIEIRDRVARLPEDLGTLGEDALADAQVEFRSMKLEVERFRAHWDQKTEFWRENAKEARSRKR
ncbi:hypothetical protein P2H44_07515 [Albimonas sp. CAU 1670]|uniref:hypothetical protein n=1 Tax=Albimonas sp. CAU 1670 TaxID=3032599 RepID=UPI0023D9C108|nr:hypothetical protein [Albimonas sp. CAU 1670]MDF2232400.1 hypothetical protein [Albimonas sp. CAU 1670]